MPRNRDSDRALIEQALGRHGLMADDWVLDDYDGVVAEVGRWSVVDEDEERGLYTDDEGVLTAQVVGSAEHRNQRVIFTFTTDDFEPLSGPEVEPFVDIEPLF